MEAAGWKNRLKRKKLLTITLNIEPRPFSVKMFAGTVSRGRSSERLGPGEKKLFAAIYEKLMTAYGRQLRWPVIQDQGVEAACAEISLKTAEISTINSGQGNLDEQKR